MKTIGVLGGISPQATMDFEQRLHAVAQRLIPQLGNLGYPPLVVYYHRGAPVLIDEQGHPLLPRRLDPRFLECADDGRCLSRRERCRPNSHRPQRGR